jgi:proline iminopeptidase
MTKPERVIVPIWVERNQVIMPVWVRGNIESGVFVVFNHGGPGSSGTLESIIEVNPANGEFNQESPFTVLEEKYAVVYWDQRHSGLSKGNVDPNNSQGDDFGKDLAIVIAELEKRYDIKNRFLIGQSWGHFVASNYLVSLEDWQSNQEKIDGYIIYKGNHEQGMAYKISRDRILAFAANKIDNEQDVEYWQEVVSFYRQRANLTEVSDNWKHYEYLYEVMGGSISSLDRIGSSVKASFFSPFNGFKYYFNNRATTRATEFYSRVVTDQSMAETIHRIDIPTLLIYGRMDIVAPVEVGEFIYNEIKTNGQDKKLVVLEQSRHGAEYEDRELLQNGVIDFIETYR